MSAPFLAIGNSSPGSLPHAVRWPGATSLSRDARVVGLLAVFFCLTVGGVWMYRTYSEMFRGVEVDDLTSAPSTGGNASSPLNASGSNAQPQVVVPPPPLASPSALASVPEDEVNEEKNAPSESPALPSAPPALEDLPLPGLSDQEASKVEAELDAASVPAPKVEGPSEVGVEVPEVSIPPAVGGDAPPVSTPAPVDPIPKSEPETPVEPAKPRLNPSSPVVSEAVSDSSTEFSGNVIPAQRNVVAKSVAQPSQTPTLKQDDAPIEEDSSPETPTVVKKTTVTDGRQDRVGGTSDRILARSRPALISPAGRRDDAVGEPLALLGSEVIASTAPDSSTAESPPNPQPSEPATAARNYILLDESGQRYLAVGPSWGGSTSDYDLVGNPLTRNDDSLMVASGVAPAGGSRTTVRSFVRKTDPSSADKVLSYDVRVYLALDGDTFENVARTMYQDPAYAKALAEYNRSRLGVTQSIPLGARVRIPPRWVLDGRDPPAEQFRRVDAPSVQQAVRPPGSFVSASSPAGPKDSPFDARFAQAAAPTVTGNVYRVAQEETLWSIAAKTLGDGRRWREIQKLNGERLLDGVQVPAGTVVRLPDDAINAQ